MLTRDAHREQTLGTLAKLSFGNLDMTKPIGRCNRDFNRNVHDISPSPIVAILPLIPACGEPVYIRLTRGN